MEKLTELSVPYGTVYRRSGVADDHWAQSRLLSYSVSTGSKVSTAGGRFLLSRWDVSLGDGTISSAVMNNLLSQQFLSKGGS